MVISSATESVHAGGAIWLNPFATVLFSVYSAITIKCCVLYLCCMGMFGMVTVMYGRMLFSSVFAIAERRDMYLLRYPSLCLCWVLWYYMFVKSSFKHTREQCESKRAYVFRCLIFSLSGHCELLFLLCCIASRTREMVSVMLYRCMFVLPSQWICFFCVLRV